MIKVASDVKKFKADRLVSITSVLKDGVNTLFYHFSFNDNPEIKEFSIEVPKGKTVESIVGLFENALLLEAEATELFGVRFEGNELSGKRLFQAEGRKGKPPMCMAKERMGVSKGA